MPRRPSHHSFPLSTMEGGVNRFSREALPNQAVDALNAVNTDGVTRRRDAFLSVATAAPHLFPAGSCTMLNAATEVLANRRSEPGYLNGESTLYIGNTVSEVEAGYSEQFNGIEWGPIDLDPVPWSKNLSLEVAYWNGSAWVVMDWWLDETVCFNVGGLYSADFDGTDDRVDLSNSSERDGASKITFSWWQKVDSWAVSAFSCVWSDWISSGSQGQFRFIYDTTGIPWIVVGFNNWAQPAATPFTLGEWEYCCVVYDGTEATANDRVKFYVNNQEVTFTLFSTAPDEFPSTFPATTNSHMLGDNAWPTGYEFDGHLCDPAYWVGTAFTEAERTEGYNGGDLLDLTDHSAGAPTFWGRMSDDTVTWATLANSGTGNTTGTFVNMDEATDLAEDYPGATVSNRYSQTLAKDGRIAWHLSQIEDSWVEWSGGADAISGYFVRLRTLDDDGSVSAMEGDREIPAPGIRIFQLEPVNGLFPERIEGLSTMVVCSDRERRRGIEKGSMIGCKREDGVSTETMRFVLEEVSGGYDTDDFPTWQKNGVGVGSAQQFGRSGFWKSIEEYYDVSKNAVIPLEWSSGKWGGGLLLHETPIDVGSGTTVKGTFSDGLEAVDPDRKYEHCIIEGHEDNATYGGHDREIFFSKQTDLHWYEALGGNASGDWDIHGPPCQIELMPNDGKLYTAGDNTAHQVDYRDRAFTRNEPGTELDDKIGTLRILQEPRWMFDSGLRYSGCIDTNSGRLMMANGGEILECDGRFIRKLKADRTSELAEFVVGKLKDEEDLDGTMTFRRIAASKLRNAPPLAKYITTFQSRIVCAGDPGDPLAVYWTPPGMPHIWPFLYTSIVRDQEQNPVTGLHSLGDQLFVSTSTNIHVAVGPSEQGVFSFHVVHQGSGFVAHQATVKVSGSGSVFLCGITPDGVLGFDGSAPRTLLDDWTRLLDGGVNTEQLHRAVGVFAAHEQAVYFAVPESGSKMNNRIVRYGVERGDWWVWEAPWGVSSMAVDYDVSGREVLLIGTDDGFVSKMVYGPTDDGKTITGYAQGPSVQPLGGQHFHPQRLLVTAKELGSEVLMDISVFLDDGRKDLLDGGELYVDQGASVWGVFEYGDDDDGTHEYTNSQWVTVETGIPKGTRCNRISAKVGGSDQWAVRAIELILTEGARRGRR